VRFGVVGLLVEFEFNATFVMLALAAVLAGLGSDWVIQSHAIARLRRPGPESRVLPGLASLGAGTILSLLPDGIGWGVGLILAGILIFAVLLAEFIAFDPEDPRTESTATSLRLLGVVIVILVVLAARLAGIRAIFAIPAAFAASSIMCWRSLSLISRSESPWPYAVGCGLIAAQVAWGLHYWPAGPLQVALVIGLVAYLGSGLATAHLRRRLGPSLLYEYGGLTLVSLAGIALLA
jgi:high-affinity Fe2+/Pb2+ permease